MIQEDTQERKYINGEAEELLDQKVKQLIAGIESCLLANLWEPTLVLLYSGIDAMAWLDRPDKQVDVTAKDFIRWAESYVLTLNPNVSGEDLYGARCGLLHSHTGESKKHRQLKAKKLFYRRIVDGEELSIIQIRMNEYFNPPSIDLDVFVDRFRDGVRRFRDDFAVDAKRRDRIYDRVYGSYLAEVRRV